MTAETDTKLTNSGLAVQPATKLANEDRHTLPMISRRRFGQMLGMPVLLGSTVAVSSCGGGDAAVVTPVPVVAAPDPSAAALSRADFVAAISNYFDWVHSSEYNDPYKSVQPVFVDVVLGATAGAKQIETALEEAIISNTQGYFFPTQPMTREDAADIYVKAFKIQPSGTNALAVFTDAASISASKRASVNAIVAAGYMSGASATLFAPNAAVTVGDAKTILSMITSKLVAPPQVMCKTGTTAPRRYVRISTPTPGAKIFYSYTFDGTEPADPNTSAGTEYDFVTNGVLQFVNPLTSTTDSRYYRLKAVTKKDGMTASAVQEFSWNIVRPNAGNFQAKLMHAATATSPAVWRINNPAEYFQAFVFYIEGTKRGLVFDAGEYGYQKANLKTFIDTIASKPYDFIIGHNHPDHAEQIFNFTSAGVTLYASAIEKAALMASSRTDMKAAGTSAAVAADGQVLDLGNVQVTVFTQPGHTNGLSTVIINQPGWVYASDNFCCNRAYTADTTQYNGTKVDLYLSLTQQLIANYKRSSSNGLINELTNAHQEVPVAMEGVKNFVKCFQQLIDRGDAATAPSIRGGILGNPTSPTTRNSRMSMVGDMWRDKNWMAVGNSLGTGLDKPVDYFTAPTTAYPCGATVDYNTADGFKKYSQLSNVEISGGTLVGVDVYWAVAANGTPNKLSNKFDPWTYSYGITVPAANSSIVFTPTAMSNNAASIKINGTTVAQGTSTTLSVSTGTTITVAVVAPDGATTSTYVFNVTKV